MAHFRATIQSKGGESSRCGEKKDGMVVNVNGWMGGVRVEVKYDLIHGCDIFTIYETAGSGKDGREERFIGRIAS